MSPVFSVLLLFAHLSSGIGSYFSIRFEPIAGRSGAYTPLPAALFMRSLLRAFAICYLDLRFAHAESAEPRRTSRKGRSLQIGRKVSEETGLRPASYNQWLGFNLLGAPPHLWRCGWRRRPPAGSGRGVKGRRQDEWRSSSCRRRLYGL